MSKRTDKMVLGINGGALGGHLGGWRHKDSFPSTTMRLDRMIETAVSAELSQLLLRRAGYKAATNSLPNSTGNGRSRGSRAVAARSSLATPAG